MFDEMIEALKEGKFVALTKTEDGGIQFTSSYDSSRSYNNLSVKTKKGTFNPEVQHLSFHRILDKVSCSQVFFLA